MSSDRCACGLPLHYNSPQAEETMRRIVAIAGELITIFYNGHGYRVQRHYIALHGLKAADLPRLAREGIAERVEDAN